MRHEINDREDGRRGQGSNVNQAEDSNKNCLHFFFYYVLCIYATLWVMIDLSISIYENLARLFGNCLYKDRPQRQGLRHKR